MDSGSTRSVWGYPAALTFIAVESATLFRYFRRNGWL